MANFNFKSLPMKVFLYFNGIIVDIIGIIQF